MKKLANITVAYLQTRFDGIQTFMGEKISDKKIIEMIEREIPKSSNKKLVDEIQLGIKNANDPDR